MRLFTWPMIFLLAAAVPSSVVAQKQDQAVRIRAAVARGEMLPLSRILALARARVAGEILEVELDEEHGRLAYEVEILSPDGRVQEVTLDARTGRVLAVEKD